MAFKGSQRLVETLRALAEVPSRACEEAAENIETLIDDSFTQGLDPYGRPWAPLRPATLTRHPHRGPPPLTDTRKMRDSISVHAMPGAGIEVEVSDPIAVYHQQGTKRMAQRQIMPQSGGLSVSWREALTQAIASAFENARK